MANKAVHVAGSLSSLLSNALNAAKAVAQQEWGVTEGSHSTSQPTVRAINREKRAGKGWKWQGFGWLLHSNTSKEAKNSNKGSDGTSHDGLERDSSGKLKAAGKIGNYGELVKPYLSPIFSFHVEDPRMRIAQSSSADRIHSKTFKTEPSQVYPILKKACYVDREGFVRTSFRSGSASPLILPSCSQSVDLSTPISDAYSFWHRSSLNRTHGSFPWLNSGGADSRASRLTIERQERGGIPSVEVAEKDRDKERVSDSANNRDARHDVAEDWEAIIALNCWRCLYLLRRGRSKYASRQNGGTGITGMGSLRVLCRRTLRVMSLMMRNAR